MIIQCFRLLLINCLFICSFGELSSLTRLSSSSRFYFPIQFTQAKAGGFNYGACTDELENETCDNIKNSYQDCIDDDDNDDDDCADTANDSVDAFNRQEIAAQAQELEAISSLDSSSTQLWVQICITVIAEMISGIYRIYWAGSSLSAWMHVGVSALMLVYFVVYLFTYKKWAEGAFLNKEEMMGSYGDTLQQVEMINSDAMLKSQKLIIENQIKTLDGMSSIYETHSWVVAVASAVFAAASIIAIAEVFQCIYSVGASGCTDYSPKSSQPTRLYSLLDKIISFFTKNAQAEDEDELEDLEIDQDESVLEGTTGKTEIQGLDLSGWITTGVSVLIQVFFGTSYIIGLMVGKLFKQAGVNATGKTVPILRIAAFILSSVTMITVSFRFDDIAQEYKKRKNLLTKLKDSIGKTDLGDASQDPSSSNAPTGNQAVDSRGLITGTGNKSNNFIQGNCASGEVYSGEVKGENCKGSAGVSLTMPEYKTISTAGFETGGISTDPGDYAQALVNLSKGEGSAAYEATNAGNNAVTKKVLRKLLKRLRTDPNLKFKNEMNIDQALSKVKTQRQGLVKKMIASIPPKDLEVMTSSAPDAIKNKMETNEKNKRQIKEENSDSEAQDKSRVSSISFGASQKKEKINTADAFKNVKLNQNDIVKKPGVSIWKVLNVRYQKSAWRSLLNKKKPSKK